MDGFAVVSNAGMMLDTHGTLDEAIWSYDNSGIAKPVLWRLTLFRSDLNNMGSQHLY